MSSMSSNDTHASDSYQCGQQVPSGNFRRRPKMLSSGSCGLRGTSDRMSYSDSSSQYDNSSGDSNEACDQRYIQGVSEAASERAFIINKLNNMFEDLKKFIVEQIEVAVRDLKGNNGHLRYGHDTSVRPPVGSPIRPKDLHVPGKETVQILPVESPSDRSCCYPPEKTLVPGDKSMNKCLKVEPDFPGGPLKHAPMPLMESKSESCSSSPSATSGGRSAGSEAFPSQSGGTCVSRSFDSNAGGAFVREAEKTLQNQREELARKLIEEMFDYEELADSNVTGVKGKKLLDPDKISSIRETVFYRFPIAEGEVEEDTWKLVCEKINAKCRGVTRTLKRKVIWDGANESTSLGKASRSEISGRANFRDSNNNLSRETARRRPGDSEIVTYSSLPARCRTRSLNDLGRAAVATIEVGFDRCVRGQSSDFDVGRDSSSVKGLDSNGMATSLPALSSHADLKESAISETPATLPVLSSNRQCDRRASHKETSIAEAKIKSSYLHDFLGDSVSGCELERPAVSSGMGPSALCSRGDKVERRKCDDVFHDNILVVVHEDTEDTAGVGDDMDHDRGSLCIPLGNAATRAVQLSREEMCRGLIESLFSRHELATSNVTGARGKHMLDPAKIDRIRDAIFKKYPANDAQEGDWLWRILVTKINTKCRGVKRLMKRGSPYDRDCEESQVKTASSPNGFVPSAVPCESHVAFRSRDVSSDSCRPSMVDNPYSGSDT